jgi:hypothetical protein
MTLPRNPDVDTILASCIETLRDVVVPEVDSEWARYSGELLVGSLEYARSLLSDPPDPERADALARALDDIRPALAAAEDSEWMTALDGRSPFEAASKLLVKAQGNPDPLADQVRAALHGVLRPQLDAEMNRAMPLFIAFARNMQGSK